ncbi:MAG: HAD family hydrolase [Sandaracinaceae bacterium]
MADDRAALRDPGPALELAHPPPPAALFRVEGTLTPRLTLAAAAWLSLNAQRVRARLFGLSSLLVAAPLAGGPFRDPGRAQRVAWAALEGMSEDRLVVLGELYAREHLIPTLDPVAVDLLERAVLRGMRVVLLSDGLECFLRPLADHLGVRELLCNAMELDGGRATGALRAPTLGPEPGGAPLRELLERHGIDPSSASAYGARRADGMLLSAVANPCAVRPDRELRRLARDLDWPVVEG